KQRARTFGDQPHRGELGGKIVADVRNPSGRIAIEGAFRDNRGIQGFDAQLDRFGLPVRYLAEPDASALAVAADELNRPAAVRGFRDASHFSPTFSHKS